MKALDDIGALLESMRSRKNEMDAFEGLLTEISSALADIVQHMEKPADERNESAALAKALTDGLSALKPPQVTVNVQPTPVTVNVPKADGGGWKSLRISVGAPSFDGSKEYIITKA